MAEAPKPRILVADDDSSVLTSISLLLKQAGYAVSSAISPAQAMEIARLERPGLAIIDMNFSRNTSGEEGLRLLKDLKTLNPACSVILLTAWGSIQLAVSGVRAGASDFVTKPWTNQQLLSSVATALQLNESLGAGYSPSTRDQLDREYDFSNLIGTDPRFLNILTLVSRIASTDASVLITGESGTGKEMIAEAIHRNSRRSGGPFVKVNLGGISSQLFESEMFGHVKGAFTDARQDRKGRFEVADGGTIFLDEIGDLDANAQVKLLRVLQDRSFELLGSSITRTVDVRVISATNKNLNEMVARGLFREDLLYRLNLIAIPLPSLRERPGDLKLLVEHFLSRIAASYEIPDLSISDAAVRWLEGLPFPGNVRQLRHLLERSVLITGKHRLEVDDLLLPLRMETGEENPVSLPQVGSMTLEEIEEAMIRKALKHHSGNISKVADALGMSRAALYRRLEKYGIPN